MLMLVLLFWSFLVLDGSYTSDLCRNTGVNSAELKVSQEL